MGQVVCEEVVTDIKSDRAHVTVGDRLSISVDTAGHLSVHYAGQRDVITSEEGVPVADRPHILAAKDKLLHCTS